MDIKTSYMIAVASDVSEIALNPRQPDRWPGFSCNNLDLEKLADLLALVRQSAVDEALLQSFEVLHQVTVDGPWVIQLPDDLQQALAAWSDEERAVKVAQWSVLPCFDGAGWRTEDLQMAMSHLGKLAALASAKQKNLVLYQAVDGERVSFS